MRGVPHNFIPEPLNRKPSPLAVPEEAMRNSGEENRSPAAAHSQNFKGATPAHARHLATQQSPLQAQRVVPDRGKHPQSISTKTSRTGP